MKATKIGTRSSKALSKGGRPTSSDCKIGPYTCYDRIPWQDLTVYMSPDTKVVRAFYQSTEDKRLYEIHPELLRRFGRNLGAINNYMDEIGTPKTKRVVLFPWAVSPDEITGG